jgi:hypothetical protein
MAALPKRCEDELRRSLASRRKEQDMLAVNPRARAAIEGRNLGVIQPNFDSGKIAELERIIREHAAD